jgi:hypothetical protein
VRWRGGEGEGETDHTNVLSRVCLGCRDEKKERKVKWHRRLSVISVRRIIPHSAQKSCGTFLGSLVGCARHRHVSTRRGCGGWVGREGGWSRIGWEPTQHNATSPHTRTYIQRRVLAPLSGFLCRFALPTPQNNFIHTHTKKKKKKKARENSEKRRTRSEGSEKGMSHNNNNNKTLPW